VEGEAFGEIERMKKECGFGYKVRRALGSKRNENSIGMLESEKMIKLGKLTEKVGSRHDFSRSAFRFGSVSRKDRI
jgi:hypothetical protein